MPLKPKNARFDYRYLVLAAVFLIGVYVVLPQLGDFQASRYLISHPRWGYAAWAVVFMGLTYLAAAGTYYLLSFQRLKYWRTVIVQLAAMFINRLLPGGIGALGANFVYLKKNGHTSAQAGTVAAINNLLGVLGHGIWSLLVVMIYSEHSVALSRREDHTWLTLLRYVVGIACLLIAAALVVGQQRFGRALREVASQLANYGRRWPKVLAALGTSMLLTACNVLCLYNSMAAMGVHLSYFAVFLIFSFAVGAGTVTPTPGGIGGYEAALVAGFAAYGVASTTALAIALFYRLVSYWLPLAAGGAAFVITQRRRYI